MKFCLFVILAFVTALNVVCVPIGNTQHAGSPAKKGAFDVTIEDSVSADNVVSYVFEYDFYVTQQWAIYMCVRSTNATLGSPLLVSVRQMLDVMSWSVPMKKAESSVFHKKVCHTLCPLRNYVEAKVSEGPQSIYVDLTTYSTTSITFQLELKNLTNFLIGTNERIDLNVTQSQPRVLEYHMPESIDSVLIEAKSGEPNCMVLSIQNITCPFYDSEETVEYKGFYQTMTLQSGITVTRKIFKEGKVYLVMILKPSEKPCCGDDDIRYAELGSSKVKVLEVNIAPSVSDKDFYIAIFGALGVYVLLYIFSFIICCFLFVRKRKSNISVAGSPVSPDNCQPSIQSYGTATSSNSNATTSSDSVALEISAIDTVDTAKPRGRLGSETNSIDETDFDKLPDAERDKDVVRTKTILYVTDLARKTEKQLSQKSKVYSWNLLTVAVFYGLPVVQLVYINQKIVNLTGNQDLCYYNFLCSHKLWVFSDFNHIYSNIGYALLGALFLLLVWRREATHTFPRKGEVAGVYALNGMHRENTRLQPLLVRNDKVGIPHHFGLFYAMGWALIMEGVLSASYHVCPNKANFQFDTAFMYVIATVCMLKLYQARHPDITAKAHHTWMILAIVLLVGVTGVLQGGTLFWVIFVFGHVVITFLVSTTIYYMGRWNLDRWLLKRVFQHLLLDFAARSFRPMYLGRFIMLSTAVALNIALDLYGLIKHPPNFAAYLLAVFIVNFLLYLLYYTVMKIRYQERIRWIPIMYMILSFGCWIAALHFFLLKNTSWQLTPALSRERNKHCVVLHFYDDHDIWHFISSCALFFGFMALFTLDDDLENTPRSSIRVF